MRAESGLSLQTCRESRDAAIQAEKRVKDGDEPLHLCRGERGEHGAIDEETRRWVRANRLQRANGEDPTRDGDGPAGRRSMSGSGSAMNTGADVREVTGSSDTRAARVHIVASCEDCEVFDEREIVANVEGESAAVMRCGYQRGECFEG